MGQVKDISGETIKDAISQKAVISISESYQHH
jgi:hypothetical protein